MLKCSKATKTICLEQGTGKNFHSVTFLWIKPDFFFSFCCVICELKPKWNLSSPVVKWLNTLLYSTNCNLKKIKNWSLRCTIKHQECIEWCYDLKEQNENKKQIFLFQYRFRLNIKQAALCKLYDPSSSVFCVFRIHFLW